MTLLQQARSDLQQIMLGGFAKPITVTDPAGASAVLQGRAAKIGAELDPETGQMVSGERASVALMLAHLTAGGLGIPTGVSDETVKPWQVSFQDADGTTNAYKVRESMVDQMLGIVTCELEHYVP